MQMYLEFDSGIVRIGNTEDGDVVFADELLNYRIDVELALKKLTPAERQVVLLVHRDGSTAAEAARSAGMNTPRPDELLAVTEVKLGREFQHRRLDDIRRYLEK
jgi:DNA-directed RNA polymerase specialized sigma24 family protein